VIFSAALDLPAQRHTGPRTSADPVLLEVGTAAPQAALISGLAREYAASRRESVLRWPGSCRLGPWNRASCSRNACMIIADRPTLADVTLQAAYQA